MDADNLFSIVIHAAVSHANMMGILSLMFWTLVLIVGLKYLSFVFRANNHGEGGVMAMTALVRDRKEPYENRLGISVVAFGLFAACLLYGDGMITPAISVLSAVEGIGIITPVFDRYVIPITIAILIGLFPVQRQGTARLGGLFGPVILVWLCFLAITGIAQIVRMPQVLAALFPWYAIRFFIFNKLHGFVVLGAVCWWSPGPRRYTRTWGISAPGPSV
jgi:KUP system potassium uptake protein